MLPAGAMVVQTSMDHSATKPAPRVSTRAAAAAFTADWAALDLAFDHRSIVDDAVRKGSKPV
jgi:hypothetical protein